MSCYSWLKGTYPKNLMSVFWQLPAYFLYSRCRQQMIYRCSWFCYLEYTPCVLVDSAVRNAQVACLTGLSSSLACERTLFIFVGRHLANRIIISNESSLLLDLRWSFCINWIIAVDLVRNRKGHPASYNVSQRRIESFQKAVGFLQTKKPFHSWALEHIRIDIEDLGQKDCALVYSIDSSFLELLLCRSFSDRTRHLLQTLFVNCSVLNILQYTWNFYLCSRASVSLQMSDG